MSRKVGAKQLFEEKDVDGEVETAEETLISKKKAKYLAQLDKKKEAKMHAKAQKKAEKANETKEDEGSSDDSEDEYVS